MHGAVIAPLRKDRGFFMPEVELESLRASSASRIIARKLFADIDGFASFMASRGHEVIAEVRRVLAEASTAGKPPGFFRSWQHLAHVIDGTLRCRECKTTKPATEFTTVYGRPITMCLACERARAKTRRDADLERQRALARRKYWADIDRYRREARERARTPRSRKVNAAAVRRYRDRHPERVRAQSVLRSAVKRGGIIRADTCQIAGCDRTDRLHAHHVDYGRPLQAIFVCAEHHEHIHHVGPLLLKAPVGRRKHAVAPPETFRPRLPTTA